MSSIFSTPKMPKAPPDIAMPDPEDIKARMAKRAAMMEATKRKGRDSTILGPTNPDGGGGKDYNGTMLGGSPK